MYIRIPQLWGKCLSAVALLCKQRHFRGVGLDWVGLVRVCTEIENINLHMTRRQLCGLCDKNLGSLGVSFGGGSVQLVIVIDIIKLGKHKQNIMLPTQ